MADTRWLDITHAAIDADSIRTHEGQRAVQFLTDEITARSGITLPIPPPDAPAGQPRIVLTCAREGDPKPSSATRGLPELRAGADGLPIADGFSLCVTEVSGAVQATIRGADPRGLLYGVGALIRKLRISSGKIEAPVLRLASAPEKRLRGHQLGWRTKSNSYDRWGLAEFDHYIRDLILWGTNAIELIPYDPDTDPDRSEAMTVALAERIAFYGLEVWLWFPFDDRVPAGLSGDGLVSGAVACPSRADGLAFLMERRRRLFARLPKLDAVFMPGGDPAGCECPLCAPWARTFLRLAEETAGVLRESHPAAQVWIANQQFSPDEDEEFYAHAQRRPGWLSGVVHAPWSGHSIEEARARVPWDVPIRLYPDITHTVRCQFTVSDWDQAFASTLDREPPIYLPARTAQIVRKMAPLSCGAISYSDGINDDLNKIVWSALLWDSGQDLNALLTEYAHCFIGAPLANRFAAGVRAIERNSYGSLARNTEIEACCHLWCTMDEDFVPDVRTKIRANWRFQMPLLRACFDRYVRAKLLADQDTEAAARAVLQRRGDDSVPAALAILREAELRICEPHLRSRLLDLGQALFDSIGLQLSVPIWGAAGDERGAILDHLNAPLADQAWIAAELEKLEELTDPAAIAAGVDRILNWEDAGQGGFYDDLGDPERQPHLVRTAAWEDDPEGLRGPRCEFRIPISNGRQSWNHYAETLYGTPLTLRYEGLSAAAAYAVRATYSGRFRPTMTLTAHTGDEIHGPVATCDPPVTKEWPVPREATIGGRLELTWRCVEGRGCQVSEVWLLRRPTAGAL